MYYSRFVQLTIFQAVNEGYILAISDCWYP